MASPAACNGGMGDVAQELHNLQLIKQQMITNEFVRATGYNQDQAVRILNHFKWDYQVRLRSNCLKCFSLFRPKFGNITFMFFNELLPPDWLNPK